MILGLWQIFLKLNRKKQMFSLYQTKLIITWKTLNVQLSSIQVLRGTETLEFLVNFLERPTDLSELITEYTLGFYEREFY